MTYDEIVEWAMEAYPFDQGYTSYSEWLGDIESDFDSQGHFFPEQCYPLLENEWNKAHGKNNQVMPIEAYDENELLKTKLVYRLEFRRPEEEITPIKTSRNLKINKNTIRRLFQELEREGVLKRTRRGHYRYISTEEFGR